MCVSKLLSYIMRKNRQNLKHALERVDDTNLAGGV